MYPIKHPLPPRPDGYPISAKVIKDSVSPDGVRLTTLEVVMPRYMLAELATHRVFSKNASSSRAIPTARASAAVESQIVMPVRWGKNQSGMQPSLENLEGDDLAIAEAIWTNAANVCLDASRALAALGLHKQWSNRPLEWFGTIRLVLTSTKWGNFFNLRDHPAAQDEIHYLSHDIKEALNGSTPQHLRYGQWHIPYVSDEELLQLTSEEALKVSSARCARSSYKTTEGVTSTLSEDLKLFERLKAGVGEEEEDPFHASPTEHQGRPARYWENFADKTGNLHGWVQYRKVVENVAGLSSN